MKNRVYHVIVLFQGVPDPGLPDEPEAVPPGQAEVLSESGQLWVHMSYTIISKKELLKKT